MIKKINRSHARRTQPKRAAIRGSLPGVLVLAFGCGGGTMLLLLAAFAFISERIALPSAVIEPLAAIAAGGGVLVSALLLGGAVGKNKLCCGLGCGAFYLLCLALATLLLEGTITFTAATGTTAGILLLSGAVGGVLSAMRVQNGTPLH